MNYQEALERGWKAAFEEMREDNDGWIEWSGGECPVPRGSETTIRFRDGDETTDTIPHLWNWEHDNDEADIIAYRIVNQQPTNPTTTTYLMVIGNECWPFTSKEAVTEAAAKCKDALVYEVGKPLRVKMVAVLE